MRHSPGAQFTEQSGNDLRLSRHIFKCAGPPFSIECLIHVENPRKKTVQCPRTCRRERNPAAPGEIRLMLLGSPPDMVHGTPSHRLPAACMFRCAVRSVLFCAAQKTWFLYYKRFGAERQEKHTGFQERTGSGLPVYRISASFWGQE